MAAQGDDRTALYRFFDSEGALLYIGITGSPESRDRQHAAKSPWWRLVARKEVAWHGTWAEADRAEKQAILAERPIYNIAGAYKPPEVPVPASGRRQGMSPSTSARLRAAGNAFRRAPIELRDAILAAADAGETSFEIAKASEFAYSQDYVSKVIQRHRPKRRPGPRPKTDEQA